MRLTCPSCLDRFDLPTEVIVQAATPVHCLHCARVFQVDPEGYTPPVEGTPPRCCWGSSGCGSSRCSTRRGG